MLEVRRLLPDMLAAIRFESLLELPPEFSGPQNSGGAERK